MEYISGQLTRDFASLRFQTVWEASMGVDNKAPNVSQLQVDWEFAYIYIFSQMKESLLEVRPISLLQKYSDDFR